MNTFARLALALSLPVLLTACVAEKLVETPTPVASFQMDRDTCNAPCDPVFKNTSTGSDTYEWSFGDGATSSEADPAHIFTRPGTYTVKLTAGNPGGAHSTEKTIVVINTLSPLIPVAAFHLTNDTCQAPCDPGIVNTSVGASAYLWNFGDGVSSTGPSPAHTYTQPGNYTIQLTASSPTGTQSVEKPLVVLPNNSLCDSIDCGVNGICLNGLCICDTGYDQDAAGMCTIPWNEKFLGQYVFTESCPVDPKSYVVNILPGLFTDQILITNFYNVFINPLHATIVIDPDSNTSSKITFHDEPDNDGFVIVGEGLRNGLGVITGSFTITDEVTGFSVSCTFTAHQ